ncbi:MAG TPA: hypothetical protein DCL69_04520, partial [Firmicutes bacterium]|nr:hypothetical protein [Bacillota bacterium]
MKGKSRKPIKLTELIDQTMAGKKDVNGGGKAAKAGGKKGTEKPRQTPLVGILDIDLSEVKKRLGAKTSDIVYREFVAGGCDGVPMAVVFVDGMVDKIAINNGILKTLLVDVHKIPPEAREGKREPDQWIKSALLAIGEVKEVSTVDEVIDAVLA